MNITYSSSVIIVTQQAAVRHAIARGRPAHRFVSESALVSRLVKVVLQEHRTRRECSSALLTFQSIGKMAETKLYTREEVKKRNNKGDAAFVIHNSVYEVTAFLDSHPGGEEVLLEKAGTDATESFEDIGHSTDAREMMKQYKIGEVVESDRIEQKSRSRNWADEDSVPAKSSGWQSWMVPLILGILATIVYRVFFV